MAKRGRPRDVEIAERRKQFVRLILDGEQWDHAVRAARIQPQRAVCVLQELHAVGLLPERQAA